MSFVTCCECCNTRALCVFVYLFGSLASIGLAGVIILVAAGLTSTFYEAVFTNFYQHRLLVSLLYICSGGSVLVFGALAFVLRESLHCVRLGQRRQHYIRVVNEEGRHTAYSDDDIVN
jgi:hypothetical protein